MTFSEKAVCQFFCFCYCVRLLVLKIDLVRFSCGNFFFNHEDSLSRARAAYVIVRK